MVMFYEGIAYSCLDCLMENDLDKQWRCFHSNHEFIYSIMGSPSIRIKIIKGVFDRCQIARCSKSSKKAGRTVLSYMCRDPSCHCHSIYQVYEYYLNSKESQVLKSFEELPSAPEVPTQWLKYCDIPQSDELSPSIGFSSLSENVYLTTPSNDSITPYNIEEKDKLDLECLANQNDDQRDSELFVP